MTAIIEAEIVKVIPLEDEWGIFEQYVFVKLSDDSIIRLFDYKKILSKLMEGQKKELTISAFVPTVVKNNNHNLGVHSPINSLNQENIRGNYTFFGKLIDFDTKTNDPIIDIGIGTLLISIHEFQLKDIHTGDFLTITTGRIDIIELEN